MIKAFCTTCGSYHRLGTGNTIALGAQLVEKLERRKSIDLFTQAQKDDPTLSTDYLFGENRGKMFGLLECKDFQGKPVILYAFSGQYNGHWLVEGWVPPIFNVDDFSNMTFEREKQIKSLTRELEHTAVGEKKRLSLRAERKLLSQTLMKDIHSLYTLTNFRGQRQTVTQAFYGNNGIPTGTGDCCGPKLLNFAATNDLIPLGLTEFFWGRATKSGSHQHGTYSTPCNEKCIPILGFMLCGLESKS